MIPVNEFLAKLTMDPDVLSAVQSRQTARSAVLGRGGRVESGLDPRIIELGKYLYLRAATREERWPLHADSGLDWIWHALILDTRTYARVSEWLGAFVHHKSGTFAEGSAWYAEFIAAYRRHFGEPDWRVWPGGIDDGDHDCG